MHRFKTIMVFFPGAKLTDYWADCTFPSSAVVLRETSDSSETIRDCVLSHAMQILEHVDLPRGNRGSAPSSGLLTSLSAMLET